MTCPACTHANPEHAKFCLECGTPFGARCGRCQTELPVGARFCLECGTPVAPPAGDGAGRQPAAYTPKHLAERILRSRSALEGERKQVTVLFADVKGSMELAEQLDPEAWHAILDRFFQILTEGIHRFEGTVNQYTGDGVMALFGAPLSHEDHAQRACYAALELRAALRDHADEVRRTHGISFSSRMGINSGEVVVGRIGDDLRMDWTAQGHTVGLAQRMEALAEPSSVLLTAHTASLVEGYFALRPLGAFAIKGASAPLEVFALETVGALQTRLDRSRARGFSRFIGRSRELETLDVALQRALDGQGQIVGVVAEAGVGKSRLCSEFVARCQGRGITVHEAHCPSHGQTLHLLPILQLLRAVFGIVDGDRAQAAREKVAGRVLLLDRSLDEMLPLVWDFLGVPDPDRPAPEIDPSDRQRQLHAFVRRLIQARSVREPAVLLIDDAHWIDPGSDAFVAHLVESVQSTRTLLLLNFRPEYSADWMRRSYYQQLPLATLGPEDIQALAGDLLGADPSVADVPAAIAQRTGGNPFFTEEVIQALAESGQLEGQRGAYRLLRPIASIEVPASVRALLAARIDRLGEREKHVLQTAAVVGREFPEGILRAVVDLPGDDLRAAIATLHAAEFIYEQALYPEAEWAFRHPLTHEVAYGSQLGDCRRQLHAAVARTIEARDPERQDENAALLAYHWDAACELEPAIRWHQRAAARIGVHDHVAAMHHLRRLRELVDRLPASEAQRAQLSEVTSRILWLEIRRAALDPEGARRLFEEATALATEGRNVAAQVRAQWAYANFLLYRGRLREGRALGEQAVAEADRVGDVDLRVEARYVPAAAAWFGGDLNDAERLTGAGIALCAGDPGRGERLGFSPMIFFHAFRLGTRALQGRRAEAAADAEVLGRSWGPAQRYSARLTGSIRLYLDWLIGDFRSGLSHARQAVEALQGFMNPQAEVYVSQMLGMALTLAGEWDEARSALERALAVARERHAFLHLEADTLTWLGRVHAELGAFDQARRELDDAVRVADRIGTRLPLPLVHFARARLLRREQGQAARGAIEAELATSLRLTRDLGIRLYEPFVEIERASLLAACGDTAGRHAALERAHRLFVDLDGTRNAERVARELATTT